MDKRKNVNAGTGVAMSFRVNDTAASEEPLAARAALSADRPLDMEKLAKLPIFYGIQPGELNAMLDCLGAFRRSFARGAFLLQNEDDMRCVGVVLSGQVHMLQEDRLGNRVILGVIRTGELFGESYACGSNGAAVTYQAAAASCALFLPFSRVLHLCNMTCVFHHRLIENMVQVMADKNKQLLEKVEILSRKSLREKILTYLSFQTSAQGSDYIVSPMGRSELADYLCADRCAMTRELSRMREEGLIDYEKNTYRIL